MGHRCIPDKDRLGIFGLNSAKGSIVQTWSRSMSQSLDPGKNPDQDFQFFTDWIIQPMFAQYL